MWQTRHCTSQCSWSHKSTLVSCKLLLLRLVIISQNDPNFSFYLEVVSFLSVECQEHSSTPPLSTRNSFQFPLISIYHIHPDAAKHLSYLKTLFIHPPQITLYPIITSLPSLIKHRLILAIFLQIARFPVQRLKQAKRLDSLI